MFLTSKPLLFTFSLFLICFYACKKDPIVKENVNGSFTVKEVIMNPALSDWEVYDTDSISTRDAIFEAVEPASPNVSYQWKIGTDARTFTTRSVELNFFSSPTSVIDVTLTVTKTNISGQSSPLTATTTRKVYLKKPSQVPGIYKGVFHLKNGDDSALLMINKDFSLPSYDEYWNPGYKGTLITSNHPYYDTMFVSNEWQTQEFLNRKYYVNVENDMITLSEINKHVNNFKGAISVTLNNNNQLIDLTFSGLDTKSNLPVTVNFSGIKVK
jgi:hypothetical protein